MEASWIATGPGRVTSSLASRSHDKRAASRQNY
jgi:hypothetical protein